MRAHERRVEAHRMLSLRGGRGLAAAEIATREGQGAEQGGERGPHPANDGTRRS